MLRRPDLAVRPKRPKRKELTAEQKQELREAFDLFDTEKTDRMDYHQLKAPPPWCHAATAARQAASTLRAPPHRWRCARSGSA